MSELVGSICVGLADILTDGITCARLLHGQVAVPNKGYKTAYVTFLCLGVFTTAISVAYRFRHARLMRARVLELSQQDRAKVISASIARRQEQQHEWELAQTHRAKSIASLALLGVFAQGAALRTASTA